MKAKVISLKTNLVGQSVPNKFGGRAGKNVELKLIAEGFKVNQQSSGVDIENLGLEVKSRDVDSVSPQSIGSMLPEDICAKSYHETSICAKIQQQLRVKTKDQKIISAEVYDFSSPVIQERIRESYEIARQKIIDGNDSNYIAGGAYGYFERTVAGSRSYEFRLRDTAMKKIEKISKSTFSKFIELS
jgi:ABC-type phosphonate transport system ATPase subunit